MVPVGLGQSARLLELWGDLRPTALFSTLTYPLYLAETAQEERARPARARPAEADRRGRARRPARGHAQAPGGALGRDDARHLRALGRLGHVRRRVRGGRRPPLLRPGRRPRRADRPGLGRAGGDRAGGDRRAGLHAPRARGDAGAALPLARPRGDPRRRVPLRAHRLPLPRRRAGATTCSGCAASTSSPARWRGSCASTGSTASPSSSTPSRWSPRSRSSSRASTAGRRSWPRRSRRASASPASIRAADAAAHRGEGEASVPPLRRGRAAVSVARLRLAPQSPRALEAVKELPVPARPPALVAREGAAVWIRWSRPGAAERLGRRDPGRARRGARRGGRDRRARDRPPRRGRRLLLRRRPARDGDADAGGVGGDADRRSTG